MKFGREFWWASFGRVREGRWESLGAAMETRFLDDMLCALLVLVSWL